MKKNVSVLSLLIINVEPGVGTGKRVETRKKNDRDIRVPELNSELALITITQKDQLRNFGSILQAGGARAASRRVPLSHTE